MSSCWNILILIVMMGYSHGKIIASPVSGSSAEYNNIDNIEIKSDKLVVNNIDSSARFTGAIKARFKDLEISTTELIILYLQKEEKREIDRIIIPAKLTAIKKNDNTVIIADSASYVHAENKLVLLGHVKIKKDDNILVTDKLIYLTNFTNPGK